MVQFSTIPVNLPYTKAKFYCQYLAGTDCVCDEASLFRAMTNDENTGIC